MGTSTGRGIATLAAVAPFAPPAHVDDFDGKHRHAWSAVVSAWLDDAVARVAKEVGDPTRVRFFNPARLPLPAPPTEAKIIWDAFPRAMNVMHPGDTDAAYAAADKPADLGGGQLFQIRNGHEERVVLPFRQQDEYCEWFADSDPATGRTSRYVFTCEGPEYWEFIASGTAAVADVPKESQVGGDRALLLRLYRALVGPQVAEADLFHQADVYYRNENNEIRRYRAAGDYNPNNKWNTTHGIVHLTHPANTLSAEIFLGADASVPRAGADGKPVTDATALICCAGYGGPNRSSDPTIGSHVNRLVRDGLSVSLRDPIGLYIDGLNTTGLRGPNDEELTHWWRPVRAAGQLVLRAEFAPPEDAPFGLDDVRVNGEPLTRAGQLAELITMSLYGIAADLGAGGPAPIGCSAHGCVRVDNPDLFEILPVKERCGAGSTEAFPQITAGPTAEAAVAAVGGVSETATARLADAMGRRGRRHPGAFEMPR